MIWRSHIRSILKRVGRRLPSLRALMADAEAARDAFRFVPAGHYYSPIPSREQIRADAERLSTARPREIPGIDLNEEEQLAVLEQIKVFYRELPFSTSKVPGRRYFFENPAYSYSDAICLYGMIRHVQPRRIIEVGSGYSSCVTLDTNELFFDNRIACTFIEPFPALLHSLMKPDDLARVAIIASPLQKVDVARFRELNENDILFIDSTHVAKLGSDVNYIFSEILPTLRRGVYVHFHDIFYPFEYPAAWLNGR